MNTSSKRPKGSRPLFELLEDQVLYSADALGGLDAVTYTNKDETTLHARVFDSNRQHDDSRVQHFQNVQTKESAKAYEVVFVDTDVKNYQQLVEDLLKDRTDPRAIDVYILDNALNGIEQISDVLTEYDSLDAIHIVSHGEDGAIDIGATRLDSTSLNTNKTAIAEWRAALDETADLLLYGCTLASSSDGQDFVDALASITGADVAASMDLTGHAVLGGNWDLEYSQGDIDNTVALSHELQRSWKATLAVNTAPTFDSSLNNNPTYTEGGSAVVMDANVTIYDEELSAIDSFDGASLTLVRNGGASVNDHYGAAASGTLLPIEEGSNVVVGATTIGSVTTNSSGTLVLSFNANATNALVNETLQQITYENTNDAPETSVQIDWVFDDGGDSAIAQGSPGAASGSGFITITMVPVNDAPSGTVTISDTAPIEDDVLSASHNLNDNDGLGTITYQWQKDGLDIVGATGNTYMTSHSDVGAAISVVASYIDGQGTQETVVSAATAIVNDRNYAPIVDLSASPTYTEGDSAVVLDADITVFDEELSAVDSFDGASLTLIRSGGSNSDDHYSAAASGTLESIAEGDNLVVGTTTIGSVTKNSLGTLVLYFNAGATNALVNEAMQQIAYQNTSDTPPHNVELNWVFNDGGDSGITQGSPGAMQVTQSITISIIAVDDLPSGEVTINDIKPNVGDRLTVSNNLADKDGLGEVTYQWQKDGVDIQGENGSTYTVEATDLGASISVVATYTDGQGTLTRVSSAATDRVEEPYLIGGNLNYTGSEGDLVTGTLVVTDNADVVDGLTFSVVTSAGNGAASIDPLSGVWTFTSRDVNWNGFDSFTVEITDEFGNVRQQVVDISLEGVNDVAVISGVDSGVVNADIDRQEGGSVISGALTIDDIDPGESAFQAASVAGDYGGLVIDASGSWSYTIDNNLPEIQQLDEGETLTDTLIVQSVDGSTHAVTIQILGAEDSPVISGVFDGVVSVDESLTYSNSLGITDADLNDNPIGFIDELRTPGDNGFGYFTLNSGVWTYELDSAHSAVKELGFYETLQDTYTFLATDGSSQLVTIVIQGPSEEPQTAAARPEAPIPIETVDTAGNGEDSGENGYELMSIVGDVESTAPQLQESVSVSVENPEDQVDTLESFLGHKPIQIYREQAEQETDSESPIAIKTSGYKAPPPIEDLLALNVVMAPAQTFDYVDQYESYLAEKSSRESLQRATQSMREQMEDAANANRQAEQVADLVFRVSGVTLSAGSLAWLLHGGSLFATALSAIPTWQGFDPLPVLSQKRKPRYWIFKNRKRSELLVDEETEAGQILDSVNHNVLAKPRRDQEGLS